MIDRRDRKGSARVPRRSRCRPMKEKSPSITASFSEMLPADLPVGRVHRSGPLDDRGPSLLLGPDDRLLRPISAGLLVVHANTPLWEVVLRRCWVQTFGMCDAPLLRWRRAAFIDDVLLELRRWPSSMLCLELAHDNEHRVVELLLEMRRQFALARCCVVGLAHQRRHEPNLLEAGAVLCCWSPRRAHVLGDVWLRHARISPVLRWSLWHRVAARMPWPPLEVAGDDRPRSDSDHPNSPPSTSSNE